MLLGNLGADPELRLHAGGKAVLNMRLATTESSSTRTRVPPRTNGLATSCSGGKRGEALAIPHQGSTIFVRGGLAHLELPTTRGRQALQRPRFHATNIILAGSQQGGGAVRWATPGRQWCWRRPARRFLGQRASCGRQRAPGRRFPGTGGDDDIPF